jgi:hypothetical protein
VFKTDDLEASIVEFKLEPGNSVIATSAIKKRADKPAKPRTRNRRKNLEPVPEHSETITVGST